MRKPHYWKLAGASSCPSEIVVVDTETYFGDDVMRDGAERHTLRLGCALAYRLEKGKRTRIKRITFRTAEEFWALVYSRLNKRRPVWVVGHNLPYDLGILKGWKLICGGEYVQDKLCVSGTMFFVKGHLNTCGLNFLDTINYYHCSLSKIGKSVGLPKLEMPDIHASDSEWESYCMNDVEVTARGLEALIAFNRKHALGPWQPTIASNAFAAYRSCFMREKVLVHCYWNAIQLERDAYYGGIVDTAYVGAVPTNKVYELDVCSMYPSVCRNDLPVRYVAYSNRVGIERIKKLAEKYLVFADVDIRDTQVPYPIRQKAGTYYPTGSFRTALAHPELIDAIERGVVRYVHRCSWYTRSPIFAEYMQFFVGHKIHYTAEGNEAFANVCKLYATNLYGKTGQQSPKWQVWGKEALQTLEQKYGLPEGKLEYWYTRPPDYYTFSLVVKLPELPEPLECRTDYGELEIRIGEVESRDSCPAIAATVTSYARLLLRSYQRIAGDGNWYYSDTDSIWCNEVGYTNLVNAGCVRPNELGYLDLKKIHERLTVYGPKDYETDAYVKRKGIRPLAKPTDCGGWEQLQFPGPLEQIRSGLDGVVLVKHITKHLHRRITRCVVRPTGYTRPLMYPVENPERKESNRYVEQRKH